MDPELPTDSLFRIMQERPDTNFDGHAVDEENVYSKEDIKKTEDGTLVYTYNDYVKREYREGEPIAILAADIDDKHCGVDHPYWYLPHIIGIYVKEEYRHQGIATKLIEEFLDEIERDKAIVDCEEHVKSFYESLESKIIYLRQFKSQKST